MEHTPGPWRVYIQEIADKDEAKRELCRMVDGTPNFQPRLVYVTDDDWDLTPAVTGCGERSEANARLIAAAPDLLEAVEQALDDMGGTGKCVCEQAKQMLRTAYAKATGDA